MEKIISIDGVAHAEMEATLSESVVLKNTSFDGEKSCEHRWFHY